MEFSFVATLNGTDVRWIFVAAIAIRAAYAVYQVVVWRRFRHYNPRWDY